MTALNTLKRSFRDPHTNPRSAIYISLLVLLLSKLIANLTNLVWTHGRDSRTAAPIGCLLSWAVTVASVCVAAEAYDAWGRKTADLAVVTRITGRLRRPAATLLCVELFSMAFASLVFMIRTFVEVAPSTGLVTNTLQLLASLAVLACVGPVVFAYSDIACKLSLVVAAVEDDCDGLHALRRATEVVKGRKVEGFVLAAVSTVIENAALVLMKNQPEVKRRAVVVLGHLVVKFISCFVYTLFYHQCKKRHNKDD